jgi:hypothetical protein
VTVTAAKPAGLPGVRYTLDGHALRAATRAPYRLSLAPAALSAGRHVLAPTLRPRTGAARVLRTTLRVAGCATRFALRQYGTTAGSALRLRVDSRAAASAVTFTLPASVAHGLALGTPAGRIRVVTPAGGRQFALAPAHGTKPASLAAGARRPGVRVIGRSIAVTSLPASTGIVDLTVYQPPAPRGPRLLPAGVGVNAFATVMARGARRLVARVSRSGD